MQSKETVKENILANLTWRNAIDEACDTAEHLLSIEVHKQWANRVLEPYLWQTMVVTATDWDNFFHLRIHDDAQPEFQKIATMMFEAMDASIPSYLKGREWHLPYVTLEEIGMIYEGYHTPLEMAHVSAARCARVTLLHQDIKKPIEEEIVFTERLINKGDMSPLEHPAMALDNAFQVGNFKGWRQLRKFVPFENDALGHNALKLRQNAQHGTG